MQVFSALILVFLAFGPQAVLSGSFKFTISEVKQCEPVSITFREEGNITAEDIPTTLTILPYGSSPISIPIPNAGASISGVNVTFLPLAQDTMFLASLDDATGENTAKVSDVIRVSSSPIDNASCLPPITDALTVFNVTSNPTQCGNLTVTYNNLIVPSAPTVRFYNPKGPSWALNLTSDDPSSGTATYMVNVKRGKEILLLMKGVNGVNTETSTLFTGQYVSWLMKTLSLMHDISGR